METCRLQHGNPKIRFFFQKRSKLNLTCAELHQYKSYSSNRYMNEKVFTNTTAWEPKKNIFFKKEIC